MVLNLGNNIDVCEFIQLSIKGKAVDTIDCVMMSFSKEALIGFAKNLVWLYEYYEDAYFNEMFYVCTDPLCGVPSGNQVIGFYLTPGSPVLTFKVNSIKKNKGINKRNIAKEPENAKTLKCIEVLPPAEEDYCIEEYELGFRNVSKISIYDKNNRDITQNFYEIFFEVNYEGLKNLAIFLMKLADNYKEGAEYVIGHGYNEEITLTEDSLLLKLKCCNLGSVYDYEPKFGS